MIYCNLFTTISVSCDSFRKFFPQILYFLLNTGIFSSNLFLYGLYFHLLFHEINLINIIWNEFSLTEAGSNASGSSFLLEFFSHFHVIWLSYDMSFLRIWSPLLKKSLMENFIFCAVILFSPNFLVWKFRGRAQISQSVEQSVFPQYLLSRKLD